MISTLPPDCAFCRGNGLLKGELVGESEHAFLLRGQFGHGTYLIIPDQHIEDPAQLPDAWWTEVKRLLSKVSDLPPSYNIALNVGAPAGQTIKHLHFWIIPRYPDRPSSGKGLASFVRDVDSE